MPLQLFTEAVLIGGSLVTSGRMQPQPGVVEDVATHYAIVQGETFVPGFMAITPEQWSDTQPAAGLAPGPALASGVTVIFRRSPRPAFETFTWAQEIEITSR